MAGHLRGRDYSVAQVAATLWTRRSHERIRAAVLADSCDELVAGLDSLANDEQQPDVATGTVVPGASAGAVWVFSGHGSHWEGMGSELLASEPAFAAVIDEIDPVFQAELGFSAREALSTGALGTTDRVQALTFAIQAGIAALLTERGITPAAIIGHSVGEVAACVAAGVFDLVHGAKVACYRARGFRGVAGQGAMALVGLSFEDAQQRLCQRDDVVAAISSAPESTVVSGTVEAIEQLQQRWPDDGISVRRVNTDVAFHSPQMDGLTSQLARLTADLPGGRTLRAALLDRPGRSSLAGAPRLALLGSQPARASAFRRGRYRRDAGRAPTLPRGIGPSGGLTLDCGNVATHRDRRVRGGPDLAASAATAAGDHPCAGSAVLPRGAVPARCPR